VFQNSTLNGPEKEILGWIIVILVFALMIQIMLKGMMKFRKGNNKAPTDDVNEAPAQHTTGINLTNVTSQTSALATDKKITSGK
jgi:hypothetical protein